MNSDHPNHKPSRAIQLLGACVGLALIAGWGYYELQPGKRVPEGGDANKRHIDWAYVARTKTIGPGETLRLVVIPNGQGARILDTKCILYTNADLRQTSLVCPDARQSDITE